MHALYVVVLTLRVRERNTREASPELVHNVQKNAYYTPTVTYGFTVCSIPSVCSCCMSPHELTVGVLCSLIPFCLYNFYSSEPTVIILHNHIHFSSHLLSNVLRESASSCCVAVSVYSFVYVKANVCL